MLAGGRGSSLLPATDPVILAYMLKTRKGEHRECLPRAPFSKMVSRQLRQEKGIVYGKGLHNFS